MFKCKFKSGQFFKSLIDTISNFIEDGTLIATPDGLTLTAIERSRIAMIDLFMSKDKCVSYDCKDDIELNLNFNDLSKFVTRSSGNEEVSLNFLSDVNKLQVKMKGNSTRTFNIPLLEQVTCESIEGVNLQTDVEITMEASELSKAIKDTEVVADDVDFIVSEDKKFSISAKSDRGSLKVDIDKKPTRFEVGANESVKSKYSIKFLSKMMKASNLSSNVTLLFSRDQPIILNFIINDDENSGKVSFFLAPQVEESENSEESDESDETPNDEEKTEEKDSKDKKTSKK